MKDLIRDEEVRHSLGFTQDSSEIQSDNQPSQNKAQLFQVSTYQDLVPLCKRSYPRWRSTLQVLSYRR